MTEEETDAEYRKWLGQRNALSKLHDELGSLLHANQLRSDTVDSKTVVNWLRMLHDIVQDGLERPRFPFPERE